MFTKVFTAFSILGAVIYLVPISESFIYRIDTADNDIEDNNFFFDHMESRKFFQTEEELIGVWAESQNARPIGIWVFESQGLGGCCGGLWEMRSLMFNGTENFELAIRYVSNVALHVDVYGRDGVKTTIAPSHKLPIPPNNSTAINWRTEMFRIGQGVRYLRFISHMGVFKSGYLLLDKIIVAVNEPLPIDL